MSFGFDRLPDRIPGLVSREIGGEVIVLDEGAGAGHSLGGRVAVVWRALGPDAPAAARTDLLALSDADVAAAVTELAELGLVRAPGVSRRAVLARGGAVLAGAGVASILLPEAIAAASPVLDYKFGKTTPGPISTFVPAGITTIYFTIQGGSGAGSSPTAVGATGGAGDLFSGQFTITNPASGPGVTLTGWVGDGGKTSGAGGTVPTGAFGAGGAGGGGSSGAGGGGGAATVLVSPTGSYLVVAGGGGGAGQGDSSGGKAGGAGGAGGSTPANGQGGAGSNQYGKGGQGGFPLGGAGGGSSSGSGGTATLSSSGGSGGTSSADVGGGGGGGGVAALMLNVPTGGGGGGGGAGHSTSPQSGAGGGGAGGSVTGSVVTAITRGSANPTPVATNGGSGSVILSSKPL